MTWVVTAVVGSAVVGAAGSYFSAKEANKPRSQKTDQTSERLPYEPVIPHLESLLSEQQRLYEAGPPDYSKLGGGGGGTGARGAEAMELYRQVADRGLGAGSTPGQQFASETIRDVWGGQGTGFEGYNPILDDLAQTYMGADTGMSRDLLLDLLGENNRAGGAPPAASTAAAGTGNPHQVDFSAGGGGSFRSASFDSGAGAPPDLGAGGGTFARELDRIFSEEANEEEIAAVLEAHAADVEREGYQAMADLENRAAGSGRFGGDWHAARITDAKRATAEEIAQVAAQLRYGDLNQRREARLAALNILNQREVASMQDATSRAGISASAGSAAAGRDLARELAEMENARMLRGQDLTAIQSLMGLDQFGVSTLAGLGGQLSNDRMGSLDLLRGFEGLGLGGLDAALGAAGGMGTLAQADATAGARNAAARRENALLSMEAPQRMLNDYLRTVGAIGSMGGTDHTWGTNVVPGAGASTGAAALQGGLGAGLAAAGMAGQLGYLGNRPPATTGGGGGGGWR